MSACHWFSLAASSNQSTTADNSAEFVKNEDEGGMKKNVLCLLTSHYLSML